MDIEVGDIVARTTKGGRVVKAVVDAVHCSGVHRVGGVEVVATVAAPVVEACQVVIVDGRPRRLDKRHVFKAGSHVPPPAVRAAAKRAVKWIEDGKAGDGFTAVGAGRARDLAAGRAVSFETVKRIANYLSRHQSDKNATGFSQGEAGFPSPGRVAWDAWGGDAAKSWTESIIGQVDRTAKARVLKSWDEKRFTLAPWYIPGRYDAQNEWTDAEELQKALWEYVRDGDRTIRLQHDTSVKAGEWVEAMTLPYEWSVPVVKAAGGRGYQTYPPGTVLLGVVWEPWAWELVKSGAITGFSIGGSAERIEVDMP